MQGRRKDKDGWRIRADEIEAIVCREVEQFVRSEAEILALLPGGIPASIARQALARAAETSDQLRTGTPQASRELLQSLIQRIELSASAISIHIRRDRLTATLLDEPAKTTSDQPDCIHIIETAAVLKRRGVEARFVTGRQSAADAAPDRNLVSLIARAHCCLSLIISGACSSVAEVANAERLPASEVSRILPLAFLAPDIVRTILRGGQPVALTAERLKRIADLPPSWDEQRQRLGF